MAYLGRHNNYTAHREPCPDCEQRPGIYDTPASRGHPDRMVCTWCHDEMREQGFARYHKNLNKRRKAAEEAAIASIAESYTRQTRES